MAARSDRNTGFTLIEVLVGTTLLALMMSLIMASLFSVGRSARAGERNLDALDVDRLVWRFLRAHVAAAVPLTERAEGQDHVLFEGRPASLRFVGHLPAHRGGGGLQLIQLDVDRMPEDTPLMMHYRNAWPDVSFLSATRSPEWEHTALLEDVSNIRFRYYGSEDDEETSPQWRDEWVDRASLPSLVQIVITRDSLYELPPLSVALRTTTADGQPQLVRPRAP